MGKVLWEEFFSNRDWPTASAVAVWLLVVLVVLPWVTVRCVSAVVSRRTVVSLRAAGRVGQHRV